MVRSIRKGGKATGEAGTGGEGDRRPGGHESPVGHHAIFGCDKLGCEADGRADVVLRDGIFFRDDLERRSRCKLVEQHGNRHAGADVARFLGVGTSAVNRLAAGAQAVGLEDAIKSVLEPTSP